MGEVRRRWKIKPQQIVLKRGQAKACPTSEQRNSELPDLALKEDATRRPLFRQAGAEPAHPAVWRP